MLVEKPTLDFHLLLELELGWLVCFAYLGQKLLIIQLKLTFINRNQLFLDQHGVSAALKIIAWFLEEILCGLRKVATSHQPLGRKTVGLIKCIRSIVWQSLNSRDFQSMAELSRLGLLVLMHDVDKFILLEILVEIARHILGSRVCPILRISSFSVLFLSA